MSPWTDQRPLRSGKYWLSLHPSQRNGLPAWVIAEPMPAPDRHGDGRLTPMAVRCKLELGFAWIGWDSKRLKGALWRDYETPADRHETQKPEHNNVVQFQRARVTR